MHCISLHSPSSRLWRRHYYQRLLFISHQNARVAYFNSLEDFPFSSSANETFDSSDILRSPTAAEAALQKVHITNFNWTCVSWKFNFRFRCRWHFCLAYCICYACGWLMLTFGLLAYLLAVWLILCCRLANVQISCGSNLSNFFSNLFECGHYVAAASLQFMIIGCIRK